jgi:membrane associated rhomboid family serine protease
MKATKGTLSIIGIMFLVQMAVSIASIPSQSYFVLSEPLLENPWTIVTSVYAHAGIEHLLANSLFLALFGYAVEKMTNVKRFHIFFLTTGMIAGVSQIVVSDIVSEPVGVLGASGAIFALMGYTLFGNKVTDAFIDFLDLGMWKTIGLYVLSGIVVTFMTASPGVAVFAHAVGFMLGTVSGHFQILHTKESNSSV